MAASRYVLCISLVLGLLVLAVFAPLRHAGFVAYDDDEYVTGNPLVRDGLQPANLPQILKDVGSGNWHPVTLISHALDVELHDLDAGRHHLTSLVLHLANVLLLFTLWSKLTGDVTAAALLAGLFAIHPLNVESVAWISERKNVLSTLFSLLTMLVYVRHVRAPQRTSFFPVVALYAVGLMAKPMMITLPLLLLLLDYWPLRRMPTAPWRSNRHPGLRLLAEKSPLFVIALVFALLTVTTQNLAGALAPLAQVGIAERALNAVVASAGYVIKAAWPQDLAVFYPLPRTMEARRLAVSLAVLALGSAVAVLGRRRKPLWIGWIWFLVTLLPVSGLFQAGRQAMADRYFYVPGIGLFIMAAGSAAALRCSGPARRLLTVVAVGVLALFAFLAREQVSYWQDSQTLFRHALAVTTDNAVMHNNLGRLLISQGRSAEALGHLRQALETTPDFEEALTNFGVALITLRRHQEAIGPLEKALALKPQDPRNHHNLALALAGVGRNAEALRRYAEAVELDPGSAEARRALSRQRARMRQGLR